VAIVSAGGLFAVSLGCLLVPALTVVLTGLTAAVYASFGIDRLSALLAVPALMTALPLGLYASVRDTFVWGGRRYRWRSKFDVDVLDE
jgi:hypothetical protein